MIVSGAIPQVKHRRGNACARSPQAQHLRFASLSQIDRQKASAFIGEAIICFARVRLPEPCTAHRFVCLDGPVTISVVMGCFFNTLI